MRLLADSGLTIISTLYAIPFLSASNPPSLRSDGPRMFEASSRTDRAKFYSMAHLGPLSLFMSCNLLNQLAMTAVLFQSNCAYVDEARRSLHREIFNAVH